MVLNYNSVPFDTRKPFDPSGAASALRRSPARQGPQEMVNRQLDRPRTIEIARSGL